MDANIAKHASQIKQLFSTSNISQITGVILAAILSYVQREVIDSATVLVWFSTIALLALLRTALVIAYQRSAGNEATQSWLMVFRLGVLASAVAWGSASFLLFPANHPQHQMFLIFMLAGVTAGGLVSYSADVFSAITNNVVVLVPLIIRLLVANENLSVEMSVAIIVYLGFMIVSLRYINRNISENIRLHLEASSREAALRVSEQQYRLLLNHSPVGILHYDTNLIVTYCNDRLANILKSSTKMIVGLDMKTLNDQSFLPVIRDAIKGEFGRYEGEYNATFSDARVWVGITCAPSLDSDGVIDGGVAIVEDISERKLAEEYMRKRTEMELHASSIKYQLLFESSRDALMVLVSPSWKFTEANKATLRLFGAASMAEFAKLGPWDVSPEYQPDGHLSSEKAREAIELTIREGSHFFEWEHQRLDGKSFAADVLLTRMEDGEELFLLATVRDITERKRIEAALNQEKVEQALLIGKLEEAQNHLLQSEKMASIGQLAAGVAHEINNPIGYVFSNLGTLEQYVQDTLELLNLYEQAERLIADSEVREQIRTTREKLDIAFLKEDLRALMEESREGIIRVKQIVQNLKDFAHVDVAEEWHFSDLHKGLDSTLSIVKNEIKYKADLVKEYGIIPEVECLSSQINQVFMNLLVNAAHAIEEHGIITISTGVKGDEVWVSISDTGKGIAPEHITKIFDPFFTTKPIGQGTGLGLSLSYSIIQKHHGRIEVQSEVGKGATFHLWLPIRQIHDAQE